MIKYSKTNDIFGDAQIQLRWSGAPDHGIYKTA
jgi:hypothetical protein